jgi:hypothetical protein
MATATRAALRPRPRTGARTQLNVLDNPLRGQDPALARALEAILHDVLEQEDLGAVDVRFRVCQEQEAGLRFICKVENPPFADDLPQRRVPLRWWSPLMETAQDFRSALLEAMEVRHERMAQQRFHALPGNA